MQPTDPPHNSVPSCDSALPLASNRFTPPPLNLTAIAFLKRSLEHNQLRRSVYSARHLRFCTDGEVHGPLHLEGGVCTSFRVPFSVSYIEIFGDDSEGDLLLGVFFLPKPAVGEEDHPQHLSVTLEGGQTIAIEVTLVNETGSRVPEYVIQITYAEAASVVTWNAKDPASEAIAGPGQHRPDW
jgi:hypothetical protein